MTTRFGLAAVSVVAVMLAGTTVARGDLLEVDVSTSGGYSHAPYTGSGSVSVAGPAGDFTVSINAFNLSNPLDADLTTDTLDILNTSLTATETLTILVKQTGFSVPANSLLTVTSKLAPTLLNGPSPSLSLLTSLISAGGGGSVPLVTLNAPGFAESAAVGLSQPNPTFELDQTISVTLSPGGAAHLTATSDAVPEPSRLVGVLSVAGMMGLGLVWRRRMSRTVAC